MISLNVAYGNVISEDSIMLATCTECYMDCNNCHRLSNVFFGTPVDKKQFRKFIQKNKTVTCVMFFDNLESKNKDLDIIFNYLKMNQDEQVNFCLHTYRDEEEIPDKLKNIFTYVKFNYNHYTEKL